MRVPKMSCKASEIVPKVQSQCFPGESSTVVGKAERVLVYRATPNFYRRSNGCRPNANSPLPARRDALGAHRVCWFIND